MRDGSTSLTNRNTAPCCSRKDFFRAAGEFMTLASIIPYGFLGTLLADRMLKSEDISFIYRIFIDAVAFVTTVLPKYRLMHALNTSNFSALADLRWQDFRTSVNFTPSSVVNGTSSVVAGATFGYLTYLSLVQMAELTRSYDTQTGDTMAVIIDSLYSKIIFVTVNFIANAFTFPSMQLASLGILKKAMGELCVSAEEQQKTFAQQARLNAVTRGLMNNFSQLVQDALASQSRAIDTQLGVIDRQLSAIYPCDFPDGEQIAAERISTIVKHMQGRNDIQLIEDLLGRRNTTPEPTYANMANRMAQIISAILTGACIVGLSNVYFIADELYSEVEPIAVAPALATMVMLSMSLLAFISVYDYGHQLADPIEPTLVKAYPELLTTYQRVELVAGNTLLCAGGVFANTYQALALADQNIAIVGLAALASWFLEVKASYSMSRAKKEGVALAKFAKTVPLAPELFALLQRLYSLNIGPQQQVEEIRVSLLHDGGVPCDNTGSGSAITTTGNPMTSQMVTGGRRTLHLGDNNHTARRDDK